MLGYLMDKNLDVVMMAECDKANVMISETL